MCRDRNGFGTPCAFTLFVKRTHEIKGSLAMLVANKPQMEKGIRVEGKNREGRDVRNMLREIAFVLKMTAKVKAEMIGSR